MNIVERSKQILLGLGASPVLFFMLALSVLSLAVMLERLWFFSTHSVDLERLAHDLEEQFAKGDLAGARELTEGSRSLESAVIHAGLTHAPRGIEASREAMASASALIPRVESRESRRDFRPRS